MQTSVGRPKDLEKRRNILDAAKRIFLERGYQGTSMHAIANIAGVSKLTLYNHFQDKATLFTAAIAETCEGIIQTRPIQLMHAENFLSVFEQMCQLSLDIICLPEAIKLEQLMLSLAAENNALAIQFYTASHGKMRQIWQSFFEQAIQLHCIKKADHDEIGLIMSSLLCGSRHQEVLFGVRSIPNTEERQHIIQRSMEIFLKHYAT